MKIEAASSALLINMKTWVSLCVRLCAHECGFVFLSLNRSVRKCLLFQLTSLVSLPQYRDSFSTQRRQISTSFFLFFYLFFFGPHSLIQQFISILSYPYMSPSCSTYTVHLWDVHRMQCDIVVCSTGTEDVNIIIEILKNIQPNDVDMML